MADIDKLIGFMSIMQVPFMNDPDALAYIEEVKAVLKQAKAQEPRLMTLEEVRDNSEVVWLETKWSRAELCIVDHGESDSNWLWVSYGVDNSGNSAWKYYGKTWRCWTSRPTDEQREAVKWDAAE